MLSPKPTAARRAMHDQNVLEDVAPVVLAARQNIELARNAARRMDASDSAPDSASDYDYD